MKKWILMALLPALTLPTMAQDDDMYFVPTKENMAKEKKSWGMPKNTYYSGSQRSVDEYNRRVQSTVTPVDSTGNDIIDFSAVRGIYPSGDSLMSATDDYQLTRQMTRFDDYSPDEAYWEGYRAGRWSSPWYYGSGYYPWYDAWYDPWYGPYGYHYPWGWNWGWYGGHHYPWHPGGPGIVIHNPPHYSGRNHVSAGGYRGYSNGSKARSERRSTAPTREFGQSPSNHSYSGGSRSFGGSSNRSGGSSFGGGGSSRSSGGSGGSGGRSFGSRR